jgi:hypothetical protein
VTVDGTIGMDSSTFLMVNDTLSAILSNCMCNTWVISLDVGLYMRGFA